MDFYLIRTSTLKSIIDAIEKTGKSESMPALYVHEGEDKHFILHETLVGIADQIRLATGKTGKIPVTELANQILAIGSTSVLGVAILGQMVLGSKGAKLDAPIIYLEDKDYPKLDAPVIRLEQDQLETPVIYLYMDKLGTPIIYIETSKLGTPTIKLEEV